MDTEHLTPCQLCASTPDIDVHCNACAYGASIGRTQYEEGCDPDNCEGCILYDECHHTA
jgi:hypothetical protein